MRIIPEDRLQTSRDENEKCKATNEGEDGTVRILARLMCLIQHVLDGSDRKEAGSESERGEFRGILFLKHRTIFVYLTDLSR